MAPELGRAASTLLRTKMLRPRVNQHVVVRSRLIARLNQALSVPLTLVSAGAGYGKTTLVSSWIDGLAAGNGTGPRPPVAWISLDENDSDLEIFLRYFVASLRTIFDDACAGTADLLQARQRPPQALLLATLNNDLALLPESFVVVLDDHQAIRGSEVSDLLSEMIRHWPEPMHVVLISRHDPALPLATLRAKGQIVEIRTRDLRFTDEEAAAYLNSALSTPLGGSAVESLERRTEGWIAGLQLASLSLQVAEDPDAALAALLSTDASFADYLADELLSRQPPAVLKFLYQSAALDNFSRALCDAIVSLDDPDWTARRCLDWLERTNLFIISLDSRKEWYRYHHLFRGVLREHAATRLTPEELNALQCRAADWFARHGTTDEALRYALAARDPQLAASVVEHGLCDALNREDRPMLERWLRLLPEEVVENRPGLVMLKAWSYQFSWQRGAQAKAVRRVQAMLDAGAGADLSPDDLQTLRGQVVALLGQEAYYRNRLGDAVACCQESLALLPKTWSFVRSGAMLYLGLSLQASGDADAAERLLIEDYESLGDRTSIYALRLLLALCMVYYIQGRDLERVRHTAQNMLEGADRNRLGILQGWGQYMLGLVHYQRNELDAAADHFTRLVDHRYTAQTAIVRDGMMRLAFIRQSAGQQTEAWEMVDRLSHIELEQLGHETDQTAALRARLSFLAGDLESAARWADAFRSPVPDLAVPWEDPPHLTRAHILVARGAVPDIDAALENLEALRDVAERTHNTSLKIEVLAARALALAAQGKAGDARSDLQAAIDLARTGGFVRAFVNLGPAMQDMLKELAGRRSAPEASRRILAAFADREPEPAPSGARTHPVNGRSVTTPELVEPLTPRELEILALMAEPWSLKEIAYKLFITHATAKRHAVNIYGKLGVNRRREALDKATELGILPHR